MKATFRISIWLNLALLGGLIFVLTNQRKEEIVPAPVSSKVKPPLKAAASPVPPASPRMASKPFRWSQLESTKDYRIYVANLRAIGCPETTIADIVRGDAERAFSWERSQLALDGSGVGPWSRQAEEQLVASLLGGQPPAAETVALAQSPENGAPGNEVGNETTKTTVSAQNTAIPLQRVGSGEVAEIPAPTQSPEATPPAYPLFLQNVNWSALGFNADQQTAIAQVRQQFLNQINRLNQNPNEPANQSAPATNPNPTGSTALTQWQTALQNADDQLIASLGGDGYEKYVQQQYLAWYQPQVEAATTEGIPLIINPDAFRVSP